jgi:hypothetical protein
MKPIFAIAPLALVLVLIGPAHSEAHDTMAQLKARALEWVPALGQGDTPQAADGTRTDSGKAH